MTRIYIFFALFFCTASFCSLAQKQTPVVNHIAIYVFNGHASTDFYHNVIQLDTIPEPFHDNKHTWFSIGYKTHLHVIEGAKDITAHDKNTHLCFSVASVPAFIANLNKWKVPYEDWQGNAQMVTNRVDGVHQIYFKDPDGYWIEINDAKQ